MSLDFKFRPLSGVWPEDGREHYETCRFRAPYPTTLADLRYELDRIGVSRAVIEMDVDERDIRLDGLPRANARPGSPRIRLSFEHPDMGPLQYPCDTYGSYQDNLRAIAKTLEAQRAMDRYGATRHHQQYAGWKALPSGGGDPVMTPAKAADWLIHFGRMGDRYGVQDLLSSRGIAESAAKWAMKHTHPDRGGDADDFAKVQRAATVLDKHHGRGGAS